MKKRIPRRCKACGTQFFAKPGRGLALCLVCRLKKGDGQDNPSLDGKNGERNSIRVALAEAELMRRGNGRVCHDCGRPTPDYRCAKCWARLRKNFPTVQADDEKAPMTDEAYLYA